MCCIFTPSTAGFSYGGAFPATQAEKWTQACELLPSWDPGRGCLEVCVYLSFSRTDLFPSRLQMQLFSSLTCFLMELKAYRAATTAFNNCHFQFDFQPLIFCGNRLRGLILTLSALQGSRRQCCSHCLMMLPSTDLAQRRGGCAQNLWQGRWMMFHGAEADSWLLEIRLRPTGGTTAALELRSTSSSSNRAKRGEQQVLNSKCLVDFFWSSSSLLKTKKKKVLTLWLFLLREWISCW